jgi:predicted transcriptional regulator
VTRQLEHTMGLNMSDRGLLPLVADITAAYCARNHIAAADVPAVVKTVFASLDALGKAPSPVLKPAVAIRESVRPDYIICLEDGKKLKMLRRHLRSAFNMTPEQYRAKWRLRSDYPMVAPNYSMTRSRLAVTWGLGRTQRRSAAVAAGTKVA